VSGHHAHEPPLAHRGNIAHPDDVTHEAAGAHEEHGGHTAEVFRRRFLVTLALAIPILVFSETIQDWFRFDMPEFPGDAAIAPLLGTVVFVHGGRVFLEGAWRELRQRQPGMMLLISLAITVAFVASVASLLGLVEIELWWELATLIVVMLLGHWQEMKALGQARGAVSALAELLPDGAERLRGGEVERVTLADLEPGDVVLVRPGARVPADGEIVAGEAEVDESMITGESKPVAKSEGDEVTAGTVATDSAIRVRVSAVGEETALAGIQRLVAEAQASRSRTQAIADRAAAVLFYVAVGAAILTVAVWAVLGDGDAAPSACS
jgi:Cu2+-exporting ATPase